MRRMITITSVSIVLTLCSVETGNAQQPPPAYGEQINIERAKNAAAAAVAEAQKINTFMAIAVVSPSRDLVYFEKMDNTQFASSA